MIGFSNVPFVMVPCLMLSMWLSFMQHEMPLSMVKPYSTSEVKRTSWSGSHSMSSRWNMGSELLLVFQVGVGTVEVSLIVEDAVVVEEADRGGLPIFCAAMRSG